jgi:hypothetical protein
MSLLTAFALAKLHSHASSRIQDMRLRSDAQDPGIALTLDAPAHEDEEGCNSFPCRGRAAINHRSPCIRHGCGVLPN